MCRHGLFQQNEELRRALSDAEQWKGKAERLKQVSGWLFAVCHSLNVTDSFIAQKVDQLECQLNRFVEKEAVVHQVRDFVLNAE